MYIWLLTYWLGAGRRTLWVFTSHCPSMMNWYAIYVVSILIKRRFWVKAKLCQFGPKADNILLEWVELVFPFTLGDNIGGSIIMQKLSSILIFFCFLVSLSFSSIIYERPEPHWSCLISWFPISAEDFTKNWTKIYVKKFGEWKSNIMVYCLENSITISDTISMGKRTNNKK